MNGANIWLGTGRVTYADFHDWRAVSTNLLQRIKPAQSQQVESRTESISDAVEATECQSNAAPQPSTLSEQETLATKQQQSMAPSEEADPVPQQQKGGSEGQGVKNESEPSQGKQPPDLERQSHQHQPDQTLQKAIQGKSSELGSKQARPPGKKDEDAGSDERAATLEQSDPALEAPSGKRSTDDAAANSVRQQRQAEALNDQQLLRHTDRASKDDGGSEEAPERRPESASAVPGEEDSTGEHPRTDDVAYHAPEPEELDGLIQDVNTLLRPWSRPDDSDEEFEELADIVKSGVEFAQLLRLQRACWYLDWPKSRDEDGSQICVQPALEKRGSQLGVESFNIQQRPVRFAVYRDI